MTLRLTTVKFGQSQTRIKSSLHSCTTGDRPNFSGFTVVFNFSMQSILHGWEGTSECSRTYLRESSNEEKLENCINWRKTGFFRNEYISPTKVLGNCISEMFDLPMRYVDESSLKIQLLYYLYAGQLSPKRALNALGENFGNPSNSRATKRMRLKWSKKLEKLRRLQSPDKNGWGRARAIITQIK